VFFNVYFKVKCMSWVLNNVLNSNLHDGKYWKQSPKINLATVGNPCTYHNALFYC